jgi:hypothetical protein
VGKLRGEAFGAYEERDWAACERKLDEAKRLDPLGELSPGVVTMRAAIRDARAAEKRTTEAGPEGEPPPR